jgi:carbonic anhydrase
MTRRTTTLLILLVAALGVAVWLFATASGRQAQFLVGGALVNLGFRMQDHLTAYDFEDEQLTPDDVWREMLRQNELAAGVRQRFPRSSRHPLVALVVCMDARLDTVELMGDTRRFYYVIRTAGSVLSEKEEEMLELAVENGVKLIVLTTHSDCAAEKVAASDDQRERFPALAAAVDERDERMKELLARPAIASRLAAGTLAVKLANIDTVTEKILPIAETP